MAAPLPPGRHGLPILGETLAFGRDGFGFIRERVARYGPIFRTSVLGRKAVVISGPDAVTEFIDGDKIRREGSMPPHIQELFGGRSLPLLDGDVHASRKAIVLAAFSRDALAAYLPDLQGSVESSARRWAEASELVWLEELKRLSLAAICTNVIGISAPAEIEQLRRDYATLTAAFASLPLRLPGTRYTKALAARGRIFALFQRQVKARREAPAQDGLSRMLAAAATIDPALSDAALVLEVHHAVIAGLIVFAELATLVIELARAPALAAQLREEVLRLAPAGAVTAEQLLGMARLQRTIMETKRLTPILPAIFGKARRTFTWRGVTVPEGWMVLWDLRGTNSDAATYTAAARFDPDRFGPGREEHKRHVHAFTPQGGGPPAGHRCAGVDYSTLLMGMFLIVLLRDYEWTLPAQNLELNWGLTPPEPADGLKARVRLTPR